MRLFSVWSAGAAERFKAIPAEPLEYTLKRFLFLRLFFRAIIFMSGLNLHVNPSCEEKYFLVSSVLGCEIP